MYKIKNIVYNIYSYYLIIIFMVYKVGDKVKLWDNNTGEVAGTYYTKYYRIKNRIAIKLDNFDYSSSNISFHLYNIKDIID
jgi:hypothetical protein